jgi:hypothetical protein
MRTEVLGMYVSPQFIKPFSLSSGTGRLDGGCLALVIKLCVQVQVQIPKTDLFP